MVCRLSTDHHHVTAECHGQPLQWATVCFFVLCKRHQFNRVRGVPFGLRLSRDFAIANRGIPCACHTVTRPPAGPRFEIVLRHRFQDK